MLDTPTDPSRCRRTIDPTFDELGLLQPRHQRRTGKRMEPGRDYVERATRWPAIRAPRIVAQSWNAEGIEALARSSNSDSSKLIVAP